MALKQISTYAKEDEGELKFSFKNELKDFLAHNKGKTFIVSIKRETHRRTDTQNNALHLGLDMVAKTLNDSGLDMKKVLKPSVDIPWTTESCKEFLFKPIMKSMYQKVSTTELEKTGEIDLVWDTMMRFLGEKFQVEFIPFPSNEKPMIETI